MREDIKPITVFGGSTVPTESPKMNRKFKDSVFRYIFTQPKAMLELARVLTNDDTIKEVTDVSLDDVLFCNCKNDLAIRAEDKRIIVMCEHQSTINKNMPLRFLIYLGRTYEKVLNELGMEKMLYTDTVIDIDAPIFIVLYNGEKDVPAVEKYSLSSMFPKSVRDISGISLDVTVYNINADSENILFEKSSILDQYSEFVQVARECRDAKKENYMREAVRTCIENGVLADYLKNMGSEVYNMFTMEFDEELEKRVLQEEAEKRGRREGREEGIKEAERKTALNLLNNGLSIELIARCMELSVEEIKAISGKK